MARGLGRSDAGGDRVRTYGHLDHDERGWIVADLEPHVAIKLKANFAEVPKHSRGPFRFPATPLKSAELMWFTARYPMTASADTLRALRRLNAQFDADQAEVGRIYGADYTPPPLVGLKPGQAIREHQARNVALLDKFGGLLCADEVGEGKTYTAAAACLLPGSLPATLVVPPHLAIQWQEKLEEFTTLTTCVVKWTKPYELPPVDVRIFSYTQLAGWIDVLELLGTGLCCFEEMHELRHGRDTHKGRAAARLVEVSRKRLGLTATPIFNYGPEIYSVLEYLRPEVLGDFGDFQREWCNGGLVSDPAALGMYLREQHAMTRKLGDGPKPNRLVQTIDYDAAELESIEAFAHQMAVTASTGTFEERGQATRMLDLRVRHATGVAKAPYVAKYVRVLVEAGEQVVLFGWHRDVYDIWLEALSDLGCAMYTGTESPAEKNKSKHRFMDGSARVLIMSLRSGSGLDGIQHFASTCVFGELDWSAEQHKQCIGRLNREGQRCWPEQVNAIFLVADDGSDPPMMTVNGLKASQSHGIIDPGLKREAGGGDTAGFKALVARYLKKGVAA